MPDDCGKGADQWRGHLGSSGQSLPTGLGYEGTLEPVCAPLPPSTADGLLCDFSGSRVSFLREATPETVFSLGVAIGVVTSLAGEAEEVAGVLLWYFRPL